jgi:hypothetical protein
MEEASFGGTIVFTSNRAWEEASCMMLRVGLDLSRKRVDVCLIFDQGELVGELAARFDEDGLRCLPGASRPNTRVGCVRSWSR